MQGYFNKGKVVTPQCGITTSDIDKSAEIHILKTLDFTVLAQYRQIIKKKQSVLVQNDPVQNDIQMLQDYN